MRMPVSTCLGLTLLLFVATAVAQTGDLPGSSDPPQMRRYEGSRIIGYRAPTFDEFVLPLGSPTSFSPPAYEASLPVEGLVSRYTYVAPEGRSAVELLRNYRLEFERLGLEVLYEKRADERGWFGPTFDVISNEDRIGQILMYNEAQERVLVGKSSDPQPIYYYVFVTTYRDGVIPEHLRETVSADRGLVQIVVVAPESLTERMTFVNAAEMSRSLASSGRVILDGLYFDTDSDVLRADSRPLIDEVVKLLRENPQLKVRVVGHTDNQGATDYNLDLSRRRTASIVTELTANHGIAAERLDPFGAGPYAPVASNDTEEGRARNRRVELVAW